LISRPRSLPDSLQVGEHLAFGFAVALARDAERVLAHFADSVEDGAGEILAFFKQFLLHVSDPLKRRRFGAVGQAAALPP
jgi:hypothetical protein